LRHARPLTGRFTGCCWTTDPADKALHRRDDDLLNPNNREQAALPGVTSKRLCNFAPVAQAETMLGAVESIGLIAGSDQ
jgi:hypothetical protein